MRPLSSAGRLHAPALLPALAIVGGAAAGSTFPSPAWSGVLLAAAAVAALALNRPGVGFHAAVAAGFGAAAAALGSNAAARTAAPDVRHQHARNAGDRRAPVQIEGRLTEDAAPTDYGASLSLAVDRIASPGGWRATDGGVRVSVGGSLTRAALPDWRAGRRVRLAAALRVPTGYRNPGARDEESALARRGVALVGSVKSAALVEVVARGHPAAEAAAALRARVRASIARRLGRRAATSAAIVTAILIGDRAGLDPEVERRLQEAGTYHVIAISGGNVAILAALALALVRLARAPGPAGAVIAIVLLAAYGYVAGGGPSVARATLAAVLYLAARALDLRAPALNTLAVALGAAVLASPLDLYDPGLALSYGATVALIVGGTHAAFGGRESAAGRRRRALLRAVLALGAATICAEIAVVPLGALAFGRVTAAGLALNFVAIPLMAVVQIAGLAIVAADAIVPPLAVLAAVVADLCASAVMASTALLDLAPWLTWRVPAPPVALLLVYYGAWTAAVAWRRARRLSLVVAVASGVMIASPPGARRLPTALVPHQASGTRHQALEVVILDVGQGDAILISLPSGRRILVDAGGTPGSLFDIGGRVVAPALMALGVARLHALAFTHPDPDHVGGATAILRDFSPVEIWEGVPVPPHPLRRALALEAARRGTGWRTLRAGDRLGEQTAAIDVLHPPPPDWERQRARNDDSLVLDVRLGGVSILLTGDIGRDVERALIPRLRPATIRVLKAAHHGSATSTSAEFLQAARPAVVVFTAGRDNRFGHPAPAVLARVQASGAQIFRTDLDGAVSVETDGVSVGVRVQGSGVRKGSGLRVHR